MTLGLGALASLQALACALDERAPQTVSSNRPATGGMSGAGAGGGLGQGGVGGVNGSAGSLGSAGSPGDIPFLQQGGSVGAGASTGSAGSEGLGAAGAQGVLPMDGPDDTPSSGGPLQASIGSCPAFDACGGTLDGVWSYAAACVEPEEVGLDLLQTICESASLAYQASSGGSLRFENGSVSRSGAGLGPAEFTFPSECADTLGSCTDIALLLSADADCVELAAGCTCAVAGSVEWQPDTFESSAGQLLLGNGRLFDYCVDGDRLIYHEAGDALENGTYTLQRN